MNWLPPNTALVATILLASQPALAASLLEAVHGQWRGSGWVEQERGAPREAVRCRLDADFEPATGRTRLAGRCAAGGRSSRIGGEIRDLGGGRFAGHWSGGDLAGPLQITGRRSGASIRFRWSAQDAGGDGSMTWTISDRRLEIANSFERDGKSGRGAIVFSR